MLDEILSALALKVAVIATILLVYLVFLSLLTQKHHRLKPYLFGALVLTAVLPTLFFIFSTVYINTISASKGPVHWHADIEIWACGKELQLADPSGFLSNKIGTATLHEHNDKRIHLEGVVVTPEDASMGNFFRVIDGSLTSRSMTVPTTEGVKTFIDNGTCEDGSPAVLQGFVYETKHGVYTQRKLENVAAHEIAPHSQVPEGDCIIIEYGPEKDGTEKLCRSYQVAEQIGKVKRGGTDGN